MGKSWKLLTSSKDRPKSPKVHTDYQWSTQAFTLKEIVSSFKLPTIVLCNVESCTVLWSNFYFELKQPLLLYSRRQVKKACAWCLRKNQETERYSQLGPPVVIPEDYDGWFQLIHGGNDRPFQFNSIEAIASSLTETFLCATESQSFLVSSKPDGTLQFALRTISAGEVLKKLSVYVGDVVKPKENKGDKTELIEMKYLKCTDEKGEELVISFEQKGKFYAVSYNISNNSGLVQVREIVRKGNKLPVFAQHVFGDPPALSYNYTGQLQFDHCIQEETVMAATLTNDRVRPLELQLDSVIRFRIALNEAQIRPRSEFIKALKLCQEMGQKYVRDMKIAFTLAPTATSLDDIDLSMYAMNERSVRQSSSLEMESDLGDAIDANSEFEIDWGPPYSCGNRKKHVSEPMASDSQVRHDAVGYYVEDTKSAHGGVEAELPSDDKMTAGDTTMIINHGRVTDLHNYHGDTSGASYQSFGDDVLSDVTDDTDIFYDEEYLESCVALDDDVDERSSVTNDCQDTSDQSVLKIAEEPEVDIDRILQSQIEIQHDDDVYKIEPSFVDKSEVSDAHESDNVVQIVTDQHGVSAYRDDTGYESDPNRNIDKYVEGTFFIYETGVDNVEPEKEKLNTLSENDTSSNSQDLYDNIQAEGLAIIEGSVFSNNDMSRYDWGDEFV